MIDTDTQRSRVHFCDCGHHWRDAVTLTDTPNLSGEPTPHCPECGKRAGVSSEVVPVLMPRWTDATGYKRHPRPIKRAMDAIGAAAGLRKYQRSVTGVRGQSESRAMTSCILGMARDEFDGMSPKAALAYWRIGERHGWAFDRDTVEAIGRECAALVVRVTDYEGDRSCDLLAWDDCRRDPEEEAQRQQVAAEIRQREEARREDGNARRAALVALRDRIAPGCEGVVIAELVEDQSDPMSDYHGHKTLRQVAVGFCKSTRDRFDWMRNAARNSSDPRIVAMADLPAEHEHRNKWSMGAGYFIAEPNARGYSSDDNSGWKLKIRAVEGDAYGAPEIDPGLADESNRAASAERRALDVGNGTTTEAMPEGDTAGQQLQAAFHGFSISHGHTKRGTPIIVVSPTEQVDKAEHKRRKDWARERRGWYYSRPYLDNPTGFAFRISEDGEAKAAEFCRLFLNGDPGPDGTPQAEPDALPSHPFGQGRVITTRQARRAAVKPGTVERIRDMADKLDEQAAGKLAPRQENTAKRQAQAASARIDGNRMQRAAGYLRAWADAAEAGDLPALLDKAPTKTEALDAAKKPLDHQANGYHPIPWESNDPAAWHYDEPRHSALRALVEVDHAEAEANAKAAEKARALAALRGSQIPGFFPTPDTVADRMAGIAELQPGDVVGDTGAGIGSLLLAALRAQPGLSAAIGYECNPTLAAYLTEHVDMPSGGKITTFQRDSLAGELADRPDVVLINPPYERLAHLDHVRRAYDWCKRRLVALVPANVRSQYEQGNDHRSRVSDWVDWLRQIDTMAGGCVSWEEVDPAAFKTADAFRSAGVATVLLIIDRFGD